MELQTILREVMPVAGQMAMSRQAGIASVTKADGSPVTEVDLATSALFKNAFARHADAQTQLFDEETVDQTGIKPAAFFSGAARHVWFVDPIAGTTCYAAGLPLYAIAAGVLTDGRPRAGCVYLPALGELYYAEQGEAFCITAPFTAQEKVTPLPSLAGSDLLVRPLYTHSSRRVLRAHSVIANGLPPFLSLPAINPGLMWTARGQMSATLMQLKLWDFAGAWPILESVGIRLRALEDGRVMEKVEPDMLNDDWSLVRPYLVSNEAAFTQLQPRLMEHA